VQYPAETHQGKLHSHALPLGAFRPGYSPVLQLHPADSIYPSPNIPATILPEYSQPYNSEINCQHAAMLQTCHAEQHIAQLRKLRRASCCCRHNQPLRRVCICTTSTAARQDGSCTQLPLSSQYCPSANQLQHANPTALTQPRACTPSSYGGHLYIQLPCLHAHTTLQSCRCRCSCLRSPGQFSMKASGSNL
jgi:hypothetical protein